MIFFYLVSLLALGIYSFSQVDLNLTLLQAPWFLNFQNQMIQLGYFNRQLSTGIFIGLTFLLTVFYLIFLKNAEKLSQKKLVILGVGLGILGLLSYPAFSHDIFNYIFDARIAIFHHANPYTSTALMFPADDWTRFMNWTHRTYPYGPVFLPLTFVFYLLGFGKFLLTLLSFKLLMVFSYLGSAFVIYKMSGKKALIFFALNPLVIYEGLVAGHMDIVMLFFALYAFYKRNWLSLLISVGIKYATILLLPAVFIKNENLKLKVLIIMAFLGALAQVGSREILPHYFLVPLGFLSLGVNNKRLAYLGVGLSILLIVVRYVPFLLNGLWFPIKI